nr:polyhydroxybutyrate depolymerase [Jannaschia sp. Os4]
MSIAGVAPGAACDADAPCTIGERTYQVALPEGEGPHPAVMLLHGFGGSGAGILRMRGTVEAFRAAGWAVVAPDGLPREGGNGRRWSFRDEAGLADDDFLRAVRDDLGRHGIDEARIVLSGFSNGAFQVAYLACRDPGAFAFYAPVAGGFWRPHPDACAGPVRLLQTHGWADSTVPLEGRPLRGGTWVQGDVFEGLALFRRANGCTWDAPSSYGTEGRYQLRRWDCDEGAALEMALHPGGHGIPAGWADLLLGWVARTE